MISAIKKIFKSETNHILFISLIAIFFFSVNLTSWKFSFVGDEWPFFVFAKQIIDNNFLVNPFGMNGVFNENRILGSIWQAIFIKLFWFNNVFGWRFSNVILIVPINFFLYFWVKKLFSKKIALISIILASSSFYMANFFKIGYLNPVALVFFIMVIFYCTKVGESFLFRDFIFLFFWLAISFYVYIGPVFPLIVWPCFFLNRKIVFNKSLFLKIFYSLLIYFGIIFIGLITSENGWFAVFNKTVVRREFSSNWQIIINILNNFLLFFKNSDYLYNHFVSGPYLDLISRILCFIGIVISILKIRAKNYRLLIVLYCTTCIVLGITNPYPYSPTTRGIFFLPFGFVFTAIGLDKIGHLTKKYLWILILLVIMILNFLKSQYLIFNEVGYHKNALIIKNLLEIDKQYPKKVIKIVFSDFNSFDFNNIFFLKKIFKIKNDFVFSNYKFINCLQPSNEVFLFFDNDYQTKQRLESDNCLIRYSFKRISEKYYQY